MENDIPVLHLVVIGFHHKKGYQVSVNRTFHWLQLANGNESFNLNVIDLSKVDYSHPPLFADKPNGDSVTECPDGWKYLPTLALPDGSHNFAEDTVFFNLPSLKDPRKTIYGISCYVSLCEILMKMLEFKNNSFFRFFSASNTSWG